MTPASAGETGPKVYRPDSVAYVRYERRNRLFMLVAFPLVLCVGLFVSDRVTGPLDATSAIAVFVLGCVSGVWGSRLAFGRVRERFLGSEWLVSDDSIVWRIPGRVAREVRRSDVRQIEESSVDLIIRGTPRAAIAVPVGLVGFDEIRALVGEWGPIRRATPIGLQWAYSIVLGLGAFLSPWLAFGGASVWMVAFASVTLLGTAGWGLWGFRTGRLSDPNARWAVWLTFVPGLLMLVRAFVMIRR